MAEHRFEILVDRTPYQIRVRPFEFNAERRYSVSYNGGPEHIFTFDPTIGRLAPIDDDASTLPDNLERAIADRLRTGRV